MEKFKNFLTMYWVWLLAAALLVFVAFSAGCGRVTPVKISSQADNGSTAITNITVTGSSFGFNSPQSATLPSLGLNAGGLGDLVTDVLPILPDEPAAEPPDTVVEPEEPDHDTPAPTDPDEPTIPEVPVDEVD